MADGGFLVKTNGKELCRCYSIAFDHDEWFYTVNETEKHDLPPGIDKITIEIE